jgi:hypothetical protein
MHPALLIKRGHLFKHVTVLGDDVRQTGSPESII